MSFGGAWDEEEDENDLPDDDTPFADPEIRKAFQVALGRFIMAFNHVDYFVGMLIRFETEKHKKAHLAESDVSFSARLRMLEALAINAVELKHLPFDELRNLNRHRNALAHGHFNQNPFDGSYELVEKKQRRDYPIDVVHALADRLDAIAERDFMLAWAQYEFAILP